MKPNHIVVTTIFYPEVLKAYQREFSARQSLDSVKVWVVGDRKTPPAVRDLCGELSRAGMETVYLGIQEQNAFGARFPALYERIPWDNESRRNVGYLHALADGCERLISIDDDNWPAADDFLAGHALTGRNWTEPLWSDASGFYNVCEHLILEPARVIYPRGYPFALRGTPNHATSNPPARPIKIGVTAGLWINEPDIDAITWLNGKVVSVGYRGPDRIVLEAATWSPINTQNTSVTRELIPAYLCVPMGWEVPGGKIQRYGDIWGGYFLQAVMQGTDYHVAFGRPVVEHRRNPHSYVDDLRQEFWGTILTDWLLQTMRENFRPRSCGICDRVEELSEFLVATALQKMPSWCPAEMKSFMVQTSGNLREWAQACRTLLGGG